MAKNAYDNRRSSTTVFVNSSFILDEFKRNISKGFYGDKELEKLTHRLVMELWRRNPDLLERINKTTVNKYSNHIRKKYGSVDFRKNLLAQVNQRNAERIKAENDKMLELLQTDMSDESILVDTFLGDVK